MPSGDLSLAMQKAQAYAWDENHGYSQTQDGLGHPGFDCSGLIQRCLAEAGFNYPASPHIGTAYMVAGMTSDDYLGAAGFQEIVVTSLSDLLNQLQHGDIVVCNHLDWTGGHTWWYMENINAYTSTANGDNNYPSTTGIVNKAKVEALGTRPWHDYNTNADKPNSNGACTEVWCHAFDPNYCIYGYDPADHNDQVTIARWPGSNSSSEGAIQYVLSQFFRKRRLEDANFTDWIDF